MYLLNEALIESGYIVYMFNWFKTTIHIRHPLEVYWIDQSWDYFKHPIEDDEYTNKICDFGKSTSYILFVLILVRYRYRFKHEILISKFICFIVLLVSLLLNMNAFVYLIPCFIYELIKLI